MAHLARRHLHNHYQSLALGKCGCKALLQSLRILGIHGKFVNDNLNVMVLVSLQHHAARHLAQLAIYAHIEIALAHHLLKQLLVVSLAVLHKRSKYIYALAVICIEQQFKDFLLGIFHHLLAREVRVGIGRTRIEQAQIVINLGCCTHR